MQLQPNFAMETLYKTPFFVFITNKMYIKKIYYDWIFFIYFIYMYSILFLYVYLFCNVFYLILYTFDWMDMTYYRYVKYYIFFIECIIIINYAWRWTNELSLNYIDIFKTRFSIFCKLPFKEIFYFVNSIHFLTSCFKENCINFSFFLF